MMTDADVADADADADAVADAADAYADTSSCTRQGFSSSLGMCIFTTKSR